MTKWKIGTVGNIGLSSTGKQVATEEGKTKKKRVLRGDWYLNEYGHVVMVMYVEDGWCMVKEGDKKPKVVSEEFVLGTFNP
jgi:hypothetical protein